MLWRYLLSAFQAIQIQHLLKLNDKKNGESYSCKSIQIQHLLKLNVDPTSAIIKGKKIQIQHLLKLNIISSWCQLTAFAIQIQHLLKLNFICFYFYTVLYDSNTTLVKVKFKCYSGGKLKYLEFKYNTC